MALTTPYARIFYVSDGITSVFSFPFVGINRNYIRVNVQAPDGTIYENVNVDVPLKPNGDLVGSIAFGVGQVPASGSIIMIERITPTTQDTNYTRALTFSSHAVDFSFDKLTAQIQEIMDRLNTATVGTHPFQESAFTLQKITEANQGQYLNIDFANKVLTAGLFMEINNGQFRVSLDGQTWINLPRSDQHNDLDGRDAADAHPISAITGLQDELNNKVDKSNQATIVYGRAGGAETDYVPTDYYDDTGSTTHLVTSKGLSVSFVTPLDETNKGVSMYDLSVVNDALQSQITDNANDIITNRNDIATNASDIAELQSGKQDSLTTEQLAAVNSGINSETVAQVETNRNDITLKVDKDQGVENNGKVLAVGANGQVELISIEAGGLLSVTHDTTLSGDGTSANPLKVADEITQEITNLRTDVETLSGEVATNQNDITELGEQVSTIESKIPGTATASNQLATKADVSAEATARESADTNLQSQITANDTDIANLQTSKQDNISAGFGIKITGTTVAIADTVDCGTL